MINSRSDQTVQAFNAWRQGVSDDERKSLIKRQAQEALRALRALLDHDAEHGWQILWLDKNQSFSCHRVTQAVTSVRTPRP